MEEPRKRQAPLVDWLGEHVARRVACPRRTAACVWLLGALVAVATCQALLHAADVIAPPPFGLLLAPPVCLLVLAYVIWPLERAVARSRGD